MGTEGLSGGGDPVRNVSEGAWKATRAHGRTSSLQFVPRRGSKGSNSPYVGGKSLNLKEETVSNVVYRPSFAHTIRRSAIAQDRILSSYTGRSSKIYTT